MEFLKKIGGFLKNHYEKVLLSVILLLLAGAAAYLPIKISENRKIIANISEPRPPRTVAPLKPLDLSTNEGLIAKVDHLPPLDLASKHHLLNPVTWKAIPPDYRLVKIDSDEKEGAGALLVTKITPLHLTLMFEGVRGTGAEARYGIKVMRETAPRQPPKTVTNYLPMSGRGDVPGGKSETFTLRSLQGAPDDPTALLLDLSSPPGPVTLTKEHPIEKVVGYTADLKYEFETKNWPDSREGKVLEFANGKYNIVAISENEVTVQDQSTGKRTNIKFTPARSAARDSR